ncbi:MAG: Hint domain-containing protein [Roseobacter sp.]
MAASLEGIRFDQIYGDNSGPTNGQPEFDTDGDGTATQEDEFVSITNSSNEPMDISGWQIWSDSTGANAPDTVQDGIFHTFPPGTVLQPGSTLYIVNEISGDPPDWAQEASEGGVESGAGGESTNFLTEGQSGSAGEAIALVNPDTGEYIIFNMSSDPPVVQNQTGFPGSTNVGTVDGHSVQADQGAGYAYRYNTNTDSYDYSPVSVPCFVEGTRIATSKGEMPIEALKVGDLVLTKDNGAQPIRWIGVRHLDTKDLARTQQHPIDFKAGSMGPGQPARRLCVSPQHRVLIKGDVLAPARGLTGLPMVRVMRGCKSVNYFHILLSKHEIIYAEGIETESLLPGPTYLSGCTISDRLAIVSIAGPSPKPARQCLTVSEAKQTVRKQSNRVFV